MPATIEEVSQRLRAWRPGQRGWFWLCPELDDSMPVLALRALREDAQMALLQSDIAGLASPGARPRVGVASIGADGGVTLGGEALTRDDLRRLAGWVRSNLAEHPDLARLHNAELVCVQDGVVAERIRDPSLWEGVPAAPAPGTLAESSRRLGRLKVGQNFWYWMTASGPGGRPFLLLDAQRRDPSGEQFARQIAQARRASPTPGDSCQGVLRKLGDQTLVFTTDGAPSLGADILAALLAAEPERLQALAAARVAQIGGGRFSAVARPRPAGPDLSRQLAALLALEEGRARLFWLTDADATGQPLLLLEEDPEALRAAAKASMGDGRTLRGQVLRTKAGWLELRCRELWPGGLDVVAAWWQAYRARAPALEALRGVRMTHYDKTGALVGRHKDDRLWEG